MEFINNLIQKYQLNYFHLCYHKISNFLYLSEKKIKSRECIYENIETMLNVFSKNRIPFILLKGYPNSYRYYDNKYLRHFRDVDIFVDKTHLCMIENLYKENSFTSLLSKDQKINRQKNIKNTLFTHQINDYVKIVDGNKVIFDTHFYLTWKTSEIICEIDFNDLFEKSPTLNINGLQTKVLSHELNFIHCCCHIYNEAVNFAINEYAKGTDPYELRIYRLLDILLMYTNVDFNINEVFRLATQNCCTKEVYYVFLIINELIPNTIFRSDIELFKGNFDEKIINEYRRLDGTLGEWKIDIKTRMFNINEKVNYIIKELII